MSISVSLKRMTLGLGLAASLFLGCQQFLGQEDKAPKPAGDAASDGPADAALRGGDPDEHCETLKKADPNQHSRLCGDSKPNCVGLRAKLADLDPKSEEYAKLRLIVDEHCKSPVDPLPPPSLQLCDSLRLALSKLDPSSEAYALTKQDWSLQCVEAKPVDDPTYCAHLMARFKSMDTAAKEYPFLEHELAHRCPALFPKEPVPPPLPPPSTKVCDSLRVSLSHLDPSGTEYSLVKQDWYQQCVETKPIDDPTYCGHLVGRLKGMDSTSREYPFLRLEVAVRCPTLFPAEPVKPADPVKPPSVSPECAEIQKKMAEPGLSHEEYSRLKQLYSEKCLR